MSIDLKLLRANSTTSPTAAAYAGPQGEVVVDTDTYCLRVQDGSTAGGHEICPGGPSSIPVTVPDGGTDQVSLTAHAVLLGEGTAAVGFATIGTMGNVLTDQGPGADPIFAPPATSGAYTMHRVTTGTSDTLSSMPSNKVCISWTSATAGAKSQTIPAANSGTDGDELTIKMGPAVSGLLTVTPASGTIDTASNAQFSAPGAVTLIADHTNNDWLVT